MAAVAESEVVREYRHLLRTASADWQETAHRHALTALDPATRAEVLGEVRRLLLTGYRITAEDVHDVARLIVLAERRRPRILLDGFPRALRDRVAEAVVASPTGRMLRAGIDVWDGAEPLAGEPPEEPRAARGEAWQHSEFGTELASPDLISAWTTPPPPLRRH